MVILTKQQCLDNKNKVQKDGKVSFHSNGGVGCWEWATGTGKSKPAVELVDDLRHEFLSQFQRELKTLIATPTEELRDTNWPAEFEKWGVSMEGVKIVAYASLGKQDLTQFDFVIYDEYHRCTLPNLKRLQDALSNSRLYVLGLSATLPRKIRFPEERERIELMKSLVPTVHKVTLDEAVELGLVSDFEIFILKFYLEPVKADCEGGTKAKPFMQSEKARYTYLTKKVQFAMIEVQKNPKKKGFEFKAIGERVQFIYNLPSKLKLAKACMEKLDSSKRTLVFAGSIEQANELCGENVYHSESSSEYLEKFQRREISLLGSVRALDEGLNLTDPDQAIIMQVTSVERSLYQRIGRLIRKRYDDLDFKAKIIVLVAANTVDEQWYNRASENLDTSRIKETLVRVP